MKIFIVSFDSITITIILEDNQNIIDFLTTDGNFDFIREGDKLFIALDQNYKEEVYIEDVTDQRGIIHMESH